MYTVFADPLHLTPQEYQMPAHVDPIGHGAARIARKWPRTLSAWNLEVPGEQKALDPLVGLLQNIQADTPVWFDGAGFCEIFDPVVYGIGNGANTSWDLLHHNVFLSTIVAYQNGVATAGWWVPGDGVLGSKINWGVAPAANVILTIKYRYKVKVVISTEEPPRRERQFRNASTPEASRMKLIYRLQEKV